MTWIGRWKYWAIYRHLINESLEPHTTKSKNKIKLKRRFKAKKSKGRKENPKLLSAIKNVHNIREESPDKNPQDTNNSRAESDTNQTPVQSQSNNKINLQFKKNSSVKN